MVHWKCQNAQRNLNKRDYKHLTGVSDQLSEDLSKGAPLIQFYRMQTRWPNVGPMFVFGGLVKKYSICWSYVCFWAVAKCQVL
jgi:hypothetical protein